MTGEQILEHARALAGPRPYFDVEDWEDDVATVALAMCERRRGRRVDPARQVEAIRRRRRYLRRIEAPMFAGTMGDGDDFD